MIYFIGRELIIKENFDVIGRNTTLFLEGMQSVSFKRLRLNKGLLDKSKTYFQPSFRYDKTQGIIGELSLGFKKKLNKYTFKSDTKLNTSSSYIFKKEQTSSNLSLSIKNSLADKAEEFLKFGLNYITENIFSTDFNLSLKPANILDTEVKINYTKPEQRSEEL